MLKVLLLKKASLSGFSRTWIMVWSGVSNTFYIGFCLRMTGWRERRRKDHSCIDSPRLQIFLKPKTFLLEQ